MERMQEAYQVLSHSKTRQQYDEIGYSGAQRIFIHPSLSL